ncbi:MAG: methionine synthase [Christensenellales bacterium]
MKISFAEALRYAGVKSLDDEALKQLMERAVADAERLAEPRSRARVFDIRRISGGVVLGGALLTGRSAQKLLADCDRAALVTVTAGHALDAEIRRLAAVDMAMAVALDAAGTAAVESAADEAEVLLRSELKGAELTPRFSPGYGDMPLSFGRDIIKLTEAERYLGVTLTESDTLLPSKSVTAVIGIKGGNSEKTGESL